MSKNKRRKQIPNYIPLISEIVGEALTEGLVQSGKYCEVNVFHDEWCSLIKSGGTCNCQPEARINWGSPPECN